TPVAGPLPSTAEFLRQLLAPPDRPGDLGLFGEYRVAGVLGVGGMGGVLRAEEVALGRAVALKVMGPGVAAQPEARERCRREAQAGATVEHPRVVIILRVGEVNGLPFIAMPLMRGRSLARRIADGPPVALDEAVRIGREIAEGLAAAHAQRLTHR